MRGEKQMKNFILKHKIILLIFLFLILLFINKNVFATYTESEKDSMLNYVVNNKGVSENNILFTYECDNKFYVVAYHGFTIDQLNRLILKKDSEGYWLQTDPYPGSGFDIYYFLDCTFISNAENPYTRTLANAIVDEDKRANFTPNSYFTEGLSIYSRVDGSTFILPLPVKEAPLTVALMIQGVEMKEVLKEIVGLLPVILSVLVSLIALRKALRILFNFLRTS